MPVHRATPKSTRPEYCGKKRMRIGKEGGGDAGLSTNGGSDICPHIDTHGEIRSSQKQEKKRTKNKT